VTPARPVLAPFLGLVLVTAACREPTRSLSVAAAPSAGRATPVASAAVAAPPSAEGVAPPTSTGSVPAAPVAAPSPSLSSTDGVAAVAAPSASPPRLLPAAAPVAPPVLLDAAGAPLPQTLDRPTTTSAWVTDLGPALWRAILADDVSLALPHFFPVVAYEQVKAIAKPARDWEARLVRSFRRDVHQYHLGLGPDRERLRFEALEVPEERAKLMKPGSEGNRLGYWRVLRSQLVYRDAEDRARRLEVTSLISWRGEWYVVHLHGFE